LSLVNTMNFLNASIGSAKDNSKSPIHNWYKFTAGFSHLFVEKIIEQEELKPTNDSKIFDPFAGCGTTLVSSQKAQIPAAGNEGQEFMYDVIRAKLNWKIDEDEFKNYLDLIKCYIAENYTRFNCQKDAHPLLRTLYVEDSLTKLYLIRNAISGISAYKYKLFFKLALSQTLHKVSIHPIAVPYIARNTVLIKTGRAWESFENISKQMLNDTKEYKRKRRTSRIYLHDSRMKNHEISDGECSICITSPSYLNNLDYGEVSKVHSHFFEYTKDWSDITNKVRSKLVTGSTTHYSEADFALDEFRRSEFHLSNSYLSNTLIKIASQLKSISKGRAGRKSFDILTLLYFSDMFQVLKEIRRAVKRDGKAYLILGDSAPYGVYIPTTQILGRISKKVGFSSYRIYKIRSRGTKWKSLRFRHSLELTENVLVLK
jgi:DNA modification methylase